MKYKDFEAEFLLAAYAESQARPNTTLRSGELLRKYQLNYQEGWALQVISDLSRRGYLTTKPIDSDDNGQPVRLSGKGFRAAEDLDQQGNFVTLRSVFDDPGDSGGSSEAPQGAYLRDSAEAEIVSSARWTGLPSDFDLSEEKRGALISLLHDAELALDSVSVSNNEKAMARAYIVAAKVLADAPEPPADLIWELIGRANALSGIASLLVSIIALFTVVAH